MLRKMEKFFVILLTLTAPTFLFSQSLQKQSRRILTVDSLLSNMTNKDLFSGAVLIADGTKILLSKGYGYSDRENKIKNTPNTRFDLSSGSKVFTGTAITYLAQEGKLKFTDTIGRYIKGLPKGNVITIHQILTHSSGFDDYWKMKDFSHKNLKSCADFMPIMRKLPLAYNPGDSYIYSTGNLIILGAVIEKITGMNYQDFIQSLIIKPLRLKNTSFTPYWTLDESQRLFAIGYQKDDSGGYKRKAYNYDYGFIPLSAGGAWSSARDLYKFDKGVFSGKVVNKDYLKIMTAKYTPQWESSHFGYIWITTEKKGYSTIGHPGNGSGWNMTNDYYPEKKYTLVILTNFGSVDVFKLQSKIEQMLFE